MSRHHDDSLTSHFKIEKIRELITWKYYGETPQHDIETYVKEYDIYLASKAMRQKFYRNQQLLLALTHCWKNLSIDFVIGLPISSNWKDKISNLILVIINQLTKMVDHELVKLIIDGSGLKKVIFNMVVWYHVLLDSVVSNRGLVFISKF